MTAAVEIVTYRVEGDQDAYLALRAAAIAEVKAQHPALQSVPFASRRDDGSWYDVWIYDSVDAANAANDDTPNLPRFLEFLGVLTDVVIEITTAPDEARNVL